MWTRIVVAVCVLAALAACGASASDSARSGTGSVTGVVRVYGGPATAQGQALDGAPNPDHTVTLTTNGRQVASATSDRNGRYTIRVAPGSYALPFCGANTVVTVRAGGVTEQDCDVAVP